MMHDAASGPSFPVGAPIRQTSLSSLPAPSEALPTLSSDQAEGLRLLSWKLVSVHADGRRIVVVVMGSSKTIQGVVIGQEPDALIVAVYGAPRDGLTVGPMSHTLALIELPEALGDRRLIARSPNGDEH